MIVRKMLTLSFFILVLFLLVGCGPIILPDLSTNFVGGGYLPSAEDPASKANFGFRFDGTVEPARIHGTYHDRSAGVNLRFTGVIEFISGTGDPLPCMAATLNYAPLGPGENGEGTLEMYACDGEVEDITDDDALGINILTGPFESRPMRPSPSWNRLRPVNGS